jgi:hypothetical protein
MSREGTIVFLRTREGGDNRRKYKIEIDGQRVGVLHPASTLTLTVPSGIRLCRARIDWTGSETVEIEVAPDEEVRVQVARAAVPVFVGRDGWLTLTRI